MAGDLIVCVYFGYHDSSVAIADAGEVLLHLEAERYFRKKHHAANADEMIELVLAALHYLDGDAGDIGSLIVSIWNNRFPPGMIKIGDRWIQPSLIRHHECHLGTVLDHHADRAVLVCADGGSEDGTTRIYQQQGSQLTCVEDLDETPATGIFYGTLTQLVIEPDFMQAHAFSPGKTMGLAAYGEPDDGVYAKLRECSHKMSNYWKGAVDSLQADFGLSAVCEKPWLDKKRCDLAFNGQRFWCDQFFQRLEKYRDFSDTVALAGGCALNVLLNSRLVDSGLFQRVHTCPVPGDSGQSIGGILYRHRGIRCPWPFLGRGFGEVRELPADLVTDLLSGQIVAWYQGRSESGPRALGHRSLLGLASSTEMRDRMNQVKQREPYRPVAPVVVAEELGRWFETEHPSPYMSFSPRVKPETRQRAPAIVHADGTSRVQTLTRDQNPVIHELLLQIGERTGAPILMNTSFNVMGEPIVDTPEDARAAFHRSSADILYVNGQRIVSHRMRE